MEFETDGELIIKTFLYSKENKTQVLDNAKEAIFNYESFLKHFEQGDNPKEKRHTFSGYIDGFEKIGDQVISLSELKNKKIGKQLINHIQLITL